MATRSRTPRGATTASDRMRKAFARRQRARRWLTWRLVALVTAFVVVVGFCLYALFFSSWLRAERVEISGNVLLADEQVLAAAEVPTGGPLLQVDVDAIARRVRSLATVKTVDVSRKWPHAIRIDVVERVPIAVLDLGKQRSALDADGTAFPAPPRARAGLPLVRLGSGADTNALEESAAVVASLDPEVIELVDYVEVQTIDEITLHLKDDRTVRWGSAEQSEDKAAVLLNLLQRKATAYDVSVPGAPTTR